MLLALALLSVQPADLVVMNAVIWTDGRVRPGNFLAVQNGRFVHVGSFREDLIGPETRKLDAGGQMVVPGLIDSHTHLLESGKDLASLQLRPATSKSDFIRRVKTWNDKLPAGKWLLGSGWSAESWPGKEQPVKEWIDPVTGERPAGLSRMDGHSMLVNSAALSASGITRIGPANPVGGVIDRDPETGEPTGILRDTAMSLVRIPAATDEDYYEGLKAAIREANRYGVTTVGEISSTARYPMYRRYATDEANPRLRFALYATVRTWPEDVKRAKSFENVSGWVESRGLKAYMDGSLGSRTAFMHEPFLSQPPGKDKNWRGAPRAGALDGTYQKGFAEAAQAGLQVIVHAIGDQANHDLLDMYAAIPDIRQRRFRIEHAQHLLPEDVSRFASLGVIPSMQPFHKADDGRYCEDVIGLERSKSSYTFRSLLRSGARLAFGSDWDVVTINPFAGIHTAVTGKILTGKVWMPHENLTLDEALLCYTKNGAYANFWEGELGSIANGYRADFVILNTDPRRKGTDLSKVLPRATYVGGFKAYP
ncbi:MAG: amidohydrolase [Fimbriimonas sp.]